MFNRKCDSVNVLLHLMQRKMKNLIGFKMFLFAMLYLTVRRCFNALRVFYFANEEVSGKTLRIISVKVFDVRTRVFQKHRTSKVCVVSRQPTFNELKFIDMKLKRNRFLFMTSKSLMQLLR